MNEQDNTAYFEAFEDFWGAPSDLVEDDDALAIGLVQAIKHIPND